MATTRSQLEKHRRERERLAHIFRLPEAQSIYLQLCKGNYRRELGLWLEAMAERGELVFYGYAGVIDGGPTHLIRPTRLMKLGPETRAIADLCIHFKDAMRSLSWGETRRLAFMSSVLVNGMSNSCLPGEQVLVGMAATDAFLQRNCHPVPILDGALATQIILTELRHQRLYSACQFYLPVGSHDLPTSSGLAAAANFVAVHTGSQKVDQVLMDSISYEVTSGVGWAQGVYEYLWPRHPDYVEGRYWGHLRELWRVVAHQNVPHYYTLLRQALTFAKENHLGVQPIWAGLTTLLSEGKIGQAGTIATLCADLLGLPHKPESTYTEPRLMYPIEPFLVGAYLEARQAGRFGVAAALVQNFPEYINATTAPETRTIARVAANVGQEIRLDGTEARTR